MKLISGLVCIVSFVVIVTQPSNLLQLGEVNVTCDSVRFERARRFYHLKINNNCSQLVVDKQMEDTFNQCFHLLIVNTILTRTTDRIRQQNIFNYDNHTKRESTYKHCRTLTIIAGNSIEWTMWFDRTNTSTLDHKRFYPFNNIVVVSSKKPELAGSHWDYIYANVLQVYWMEIKQEQIANDTVHIVPERIVHLPTQNELELSSHDFSQSLIKFQSFGKPFDWKSYRYTKSFRSSQYNCTPYVIPKYNSSGAVVKYEGVESMFLTEITRHWSFEPVNQRHIQDGYDLTIDEMAANHTDIAVCGIWLNSVLEQRFDCSEYFDFMCGTFLVPKPVMLNAASNIVLSFTGWVWLATLASVIITLVSLTSISSIRSGFKETDTNSRRHVGWELSFLDLSAVSLMQYVSFANNQIPIKCVIVSWIVLCVVLSVVYTTGYTALLSIPRFSKPIDTLDDFLANDLRWGIIAPNRPHFEELQLSLVPNYRKLLDASFDEIDVDERLVNMATHGHYAVFVKVHYNRFVTDIMNIFNASLKMRLMKSCFYNQYTTLVLQKHSPYTEYVNEYIVRFRESGIFHYWATEIRTILTSRVRHFFTKESNDHSGSSLNLINLSGAFYVHLIGIGLSIIVFFVEIYKFSKLRNIIKTQN